ncbi:hypothetical protein GCM10008968_18440 [Bacillus horti]
MEYIMFLVLVIILYNQYKILQEIKDLRYSVSSIKERLDKDTNE